jgi:hypothetical protein
VKAYTEEHYRNIGVRLPQYIKRLNGEVTSTLALQALITDRAGADEEPIIPLTTLVARPTFLNMTKNGNSPKIYSQGRALKQDLGVISSDRAYATAQTAGGSSLHPRDRSPLGGGGAGSHGAVDAKAPGEPQALRSWGGAGIPGEQILVKGSRMGEPLTTA